MKQLLPLSVLVVSQHIAVAASPTASVEPSVLPAYVSSVIKIRIVLPDGLKAGEIVSTQLPNAALADSLSYSLTKTLDTGPRRFSWNNVQVTSSAPGATFDVSVAKAEFEDAGDPKAERHGQRVSAKLKTGTIPTDGSITFSYATTTPWIVSKAFPVRVDVNGERLTPDPTFVVEPGPASSTQVILPSAARPGARVRIQLISRDSFDNLAATPVGPINLTLEGQVIASGITFAGRYETEIAFPKVGIYRVEANGILSNPIRITPDPQGPYWGDLHSHNSFSADALSSDSNPDHYTYARDVSGVDFTALTNHIFGLETNYWQRTRQWCRQYEQPGRFIPILAFEGGFGYHLDGYFPDCNGPAPNNQRRGAGRMDVRDFTDFEEFVDRERLQVAVHHSGVNWGGADFDGTDRFPRQMRLIEVFSAHGQSELYDPADALSYEQALSSPVSASLKGRHYARDAWAGGYKFYTLASSDDHNGQPGKRANGLTAIAAPALDRASLLEAMAQGHVYGTTGERILLDFAINGRPMGSVINVAKGKRLTFRIETHGTDELSRVSVFRYVFGSDQGWETVFEKSGSLGLDFTANWTQASEGRAVYYARIEQAKPIRVLVPVLQDRPARAWSSPIWNGEPVVKPLPATAEQEEPLSRHPWPVQRQR